ncbi:MAG: hypothetical protein RLZZ12_958, partial [Actinomycetota bacterium]
KKAGTAIVTVTQLESTNYSSGVAATTIEVLPAVTAKLKNRRITVKVIGASATVRINGIKGKVGVNKVGPGTRKVVVSSGGETIFSKTFKVP